MRLDRARSAFWRRGPFRALALAAVLLTLVVPLPGCSSQQTAPSRVVKQIDMGQSRDGRIVIFFNVNGSDTYSVHIKDTATGLELQPIESSTTRRFKAIPFTAKRGLTIEVTCSNGSVTLRDSEIDIPGASTSLYSKAILVDSGTPQAIFTTPVGVIVQSTN